MKITDTVCLMCKNKCFDKLGIDIPNLSMELDIRHLSYQKGETIFKQNSFASYIVFLRSGLLRIVLEESKMRNLTLTYLTDTIFLDFSLLDGSNSYPFTAQSLINSELCFLSAHQFLELIKNNSRAYEYILKEFSLQHRNTMKRLSEIALKNALGRFATVLLYLNEPILQKYHIYKIISRREIADFADISLESVNKFINELRNDKLIEISDKSIEIVDIEMIKRLSIIG